MDPQRAALQQYMADLGRLYRELPELWRTDPDPEGFAWIDCSDRDNSVVSYVRRDGARHLVIVLNFTPVPRENYCIGAPQAGTYVVRLSSDDRRYGGSDFRNSPGGMHRPGTVPRPRTVDAAAPAAFGRVGPDTEVNTTQFGVNCCGTRDFRLKKHVAADSGFSGPGAHRQWKTGSSLN